MRQYEIIVMAMVLAALPAAAATKDRTKQTSATDDTWHVGLTVEDDVPQLQTDKNGKTLVPASASHWQV